MSSSAQGAPGGSGERPAPLSRFMRRASKVLRRGSSKRESFSSAQEEPSAPVAGAAGETIPEQAVSDPTEAVTTAAAAAKPTTAPTKAPAASKVTPPVPAAIQQPTRDIKPSAKPLNARLAKTAAESSAIQEEKARVLFAKYGLTLAPGEWTPPARGDAERVEKKVRMRVRRTCHRCQTSFGADKTCSSCNHTRCKKCPRYPAKTKDGKKKDTALAVDENAVMIPLTYKHRATGKDMERKKPVQRVRRTCHMCKGLFVGRAVECAGCKHLRCPKCPRDPPKLNKYPDGYPGDREEMYPLAVRHRKKVRVHVRWTCHSCQGSFKDHVKICEGCGHERCEQCPRYPPKKEKKEFDEDVVRSVEEKLRNISLSPQASAA